MGINYRGGSDMGVGNGKNRDPSEIGFCNFRNLCSNNYLKILLIFNFCIYCHTSFEFKRFLSVLNDFKM